MNNKTFKNALVILCLVSSFSCEIDSGEIVKEAATVGRKIEIFQGRVAEFPQADALYRKTLELAKQQNGHLKENFYDFEIITNSVQRITSDNDEYFTFPIIRAEYDKLHTENLVIANKQGETPKAYIVSYVPDNAYLERLKDNPNTLFSGEQGIQLLGEVAEVTARSSSGCYTIEQVHCASDQHEPNGFGGTIAGPGCTEPYTVVTVICPPPTGGGGSTGNETPPGGGGSGSGGSGGNGNDPDPDSELDPDIMSNPMIVATRLANILNLSSYSSSWDWVFNSENAEEVAQMLSFVEDNDRSERAKAFANAILREDIDTLTRLLIDNGGAFAPQNCCPNNDNAEVLGQITVDLVNDFLDAGFNLFVNIFEPLRSDARNGRFVRLIMEETGVEVPAEIENATLGELFKVRKRNRKLAVEPTGDYWDGVVDRGISVLDFMGLLSPSTGGGAFLFIKGGGAFTKKALSDFLETLAKNPEFLTKLKNLPATKQEALLNLMRNQKKPAGFAGKFNFTATKNIGGKQISVKYDANGFPDFTPHASSPNHVFKSDDLVGNGTTTDFTNAYNWLRNNFPNLNIARVGQRVRINGELHTWHHHQDGLSMFPVPTVIHQAFNHSGGNAVIIEGLKELFKGPTF